VRFTLRANDDAPIGAAIGGKVTYGPSRVTIADFTANIVRAPDEPIAPLMVESPSRGETITETSVLSGTANPGATVRITGAWGTDLGSAVAHSRTGEWAITWPRDYQPARYAGGVVTETIGGALVSSIGFDFALAR